MLRVVDPRSKAVYVLVPADDYAAVQELLEEERQRRAIGTVALHNAERRMARLGRKTWPETSSI